VMERLVILSGKTIDEKLVKAYAVPNFSWRLKVEG
jgi:hypothetical protein